MLGVGENLEIWDAKRLGRHKEIIRAKNEWNLFKCAGNYLHKPVFLGSGWWVEYFSGGTYVDATFGRGGHSVEILSRLGLDGKLIAIDKDPEAIECAKALKINDYPFTMEVFQN